MQELLFQREFVRVAEWAADRPALRDHGTGSTSTFATHKERVARLCHGLREQLDVRRADCYSVLLDNRSAYMELWHAGLCGGGIINTVNARVSSDELLYTLKDAGSKVAFVSEAFLPMVAALRPQLPDLERVVLVGEGVGPHDLRYEDVLSAAAPVLPELGAEDDPCILMYTGGTTGVPRGVLLDQRAVMLNWRRFCEALHPTKEWSFLQVIPMFHVGSMLSILTCHLAGACVTVLPVWEPAQALDVIESERIGALGIVPAMGVQLLSHPSFVPERIQSLRYVGYGAAPMPQGLLQDLLAVLPPEATICQAYGMTECCGVISILNGEDHRSGDLDRLRSAGRAMAGVRWSIRDLDGNEVPIGEVGEIWVECGSTMQGYWNKPEATAEVLHDGWYRSGDLGRVDRYGYLTVADRLKDMMITGGENVYSIEVENAISTLPGILRVAVVGVPHPVWGEAVHAVVQVPAGSPVTAEAVQQHAARTLARYKVPKTVRIQEADFPVSPGGKVLKRQLREEPVRVDG